MSDPLPYVDVGVARTRQWLRDDRGVHSELRDLQAVDGIAVASLALSDPRAGSDALSRRAALALVPLFDAGEETPDDETNARTSALAEALSDQDGLVLWTPPGASLPPPTNDAALRQIREAAAALAPGQSGEVAFPVTLAIRKVGDEGSYLSVQGGLSPHWARFTNQVFGQFQLDSNAIHRLPADPAKVTQLVDFLVLIANGVRTTGHTADAPAEDHWSLQRLDGVSGVRIIAAAPASEPEGGTPVRKALRTGTRAALRALARADTPLRLITYVGIFRSIEEETASIALRGLDPTTFAQLDAVCLVADAQLRVLFGPAPQSGLGDSQPR